MPASTPKTPWSDTLNEAWLQNFSEQSRKQIQQLLGAGQDEILKQYYESWQHFLQSSMDDPGRWWKTLVEYQQKQLNLWHQAMTGKKDATTSGSASDKRFQDKQWNEHPVFDSIKQSYLLMTSLFEEMTDKAEMDSKQKQTLKFYTRQFLDAISPSNFFMTNPEIMQLAVETKGQSLIDGLENLLSDLEKGRISMTDEQAFTLGENIAVTPGKVVFQNELMQLIEYAPSTEKVYERPTLIIPPCINKYYILDLQPDNSFVKFCVDSGQHTFLISWCNPSAAQSHLNWDDYLQEGVFKALEVVQNIHGTPAKVNAVAWCIGGTLLASALAVMEKKKDRRVGSATFLTTLTEFSEPGELGVFISPEQVEALIEKVNGAGYLSGKDLSTTFNMLRANDLIWSYVVNNYLKGKQPPPFDILYWNSDPTNLPASMYSFYLRKLYLENCLIQPDALTLCGEPVDLSKISIPCYFLSTAEDHIAPWKSTYKGARHFGGQPEFVLGASGHVAGVINPISKNRRHYWTNSNLPDTADEWLANATQEPGSWWGHWQQWLKRRAGKQIEAPDSPGNSSYPPLESAPGSFVTTRL
ncbi:PHA/PHB synthase family protein [Pokkaliibacter plantistimulans]|uniref:PHA/PHB synthase family protein n=1 Tax=Pokkaliibacter plantistimulans TaxID=1635171 RepID=UPI000D748EE2|nr:class I poly(R)-hydroxyalkanoic acid synthase [Pokkaliibacter plantistimulans]